MNKPLLPRLCAEAIGTFAIVFFGCGSIMVLEHAPGSMSLIAIPVVFGAVVASMIYGLGHISGAHFNPAVTLAFAVVRHFPFTEVIAYWCAQVIGAVLAAGALAFLFGPGSSFGATVPHVPLARAFGWEFIMTYFLMLIIMAVATDVRAVGILAGIAIGAIVMLDAFIGGWATGASMNPARSFAPALFQGTLDSMWLYCLAPTSGAIAGALSYKIIAKK